MEIGASQTADLASLRQALGIMTMRKALKQDSQTVATLLNDMAVTASKSLEQASEPHKGTTIDVRV